MRTAAGRLMVMTGMLAWTLLVGSGCIFFPDTCNGGFNMSAPRIENGVETDATGLFVRIEWDDGTDRGAGLPSAYFADVSLEPLGDADLLAAGVVLTADRELTVRFDSAVTAQMLADASTTSFRLVFPDRREHIDCTHIGSDDTYFMDVTLGFDNSGDIATTLFDQRLVVGPI